MNELTVSPNFHKFAKTLLTRAQEYRAAIDEMDQWAGTFQDILEQLNEKLSLEANLDENALRAKRREFNADLSVQLKEDKRKVLVNLLEEFGLVEISREAFENAEEAHKKAVDDAVAITREYYQKKGDEVVAAIKSELVEVKAALHYKDSTITSLQEDINRMRADYQALLTTHEKTLEAMSRRSDNIIVGK